MQHVTGTCICRNGYVELGEEFGDGGLTWRSHAHLSALQSRCWPVKYPAARIGARIRTWSPLVHVRRARAGAFFG
jgi:hypothetical protein